MVYVRNFNSFDTVFSTPTPLNFTLTPYPEFTFPQTSASVYFINPTSVITIIALVSQCFQFNPSTPAVIDCGPLSDPVNGMVLVSLDTTLGATARYDCIPGYKLTGLSGDVRFCTVTGEWSETDPTCERT